MLRDQSCRGVWTLTVADDSTESHQLRSPAGGGKMGCGKTFIQREPRDDRIMMEACLRAVGEKVANEAGLRQDRISKMQIQ